MNLVQKLYVAAVVTISAVVSLVFFIYIQPGKTMKLKWRRSYKKMTVPLEGSKESLPKTNFRSSFRFGSGRRREKENAESRREPSLDQETLKQNQLGHNISDTLESVASASYVYSQSSEEESVYKLDASKPKKFSKHKPKSKEIDGYVGFANLPNQVYWRAVKRGFEFTVMVVGESGLGKSTLINSMFLTDIYNSSEHPGPTQRMKKTVSVEATKVMLKEFGVNLLLTVVDTPGFGDAVNNINCWMPIVEYIDDKYENYWNSETKLSRITTADQRVDCCLYFIKPSGHGLRPLDIEAMKHLCDKVNLVPVIAKADTLTPEECADFKKRILQEIVDHNISIYQFPELSEEDEVYEQNESFRELVPFAVAASNTVLEVDGKKIRGRKYPWGVVDIENLAHCDFWALKQMIICTHMQDLKDITHNVHYENYRCNKLAGFGEKVVQRKPMVDMEEEKRKQEVKMEAIKADMEEVFLDKVREKAQKLKNCEMELKKKCEESKRELEKKARELEEERRKFILEKEAWEREQGVFGYNSLGIIGDGKKKKKGLF